jgi:hypothetical protein
VQVNVGFKKYRGQFPSFFIADWVEDRCWRIANRRGGWCWCLIPVAYAHRQRCAALRAEDTQNAGTVPAFLFDAKWYCILGVVGYRIAVSLNAFLESLLSIHRFGKPTGQSQAANRNRKRSFRCCKIFVGIGTLGSFGYLKMINLLRKVFFKDYR